MITLAIECATQTVGIAFLDQQKILAELYLDTGGGHAGILLPALEKLLSMTGLKMEQVGLLACTTGPGSFTGVRIGVSTIKGLALAAGKPIVGVSTLEALAMNALPSRKRICALLDARRGQVYAGLYRSGPEGFPEAVAPDRLTDIESLFEDVAADEVDFVGDISVLGQMQICGEGMPASAMRRPGCCRLNASAVGLIALHRHRHGRIENPLTFSPRYLRLSEAEDKGTK